ncbi:MAG: Holliday junction resolvase RuvX [Gammaproteobacteria bacterium]
MSPGTPEAPSPETPAGATPPAPRDPSRPEIVLALDYGLRRIGLAVADTLTRAPRPLAALQVIGDAGPGERELTALDALARELGAHRLVAGCPYNADGSAHPLAGRARSFAAALGARRALPVHTVDERFSSLEAEERLRERRASGLKRGRVAKGEADSVSAAVILERWLSGEGRTDG